MHSVFTRTFVSAICLAAYSMAGADPVAPPQPETSSYPGADGWRIQVQCKGTDADDDCSTTAQKDGLPSVPILGSPHAPGVTWYGKRAGVRLDCGTACWGTLFFTPPNKVTGPFDAIDAISANGRYAVRISSNPLVVFDVQTGKAVARLKLATKDKNPLVSGAIQSSEFKGQTLVVDYLDGHGVQRKATLVVPHGE
ncbi:hypothetical protein [Paludibacterium purpuratum]|nr:hypothetical protein [Paludibacterium purpuratum]